MFDASRISSNSDLVVLSCIFICIADKFSSTQAMDYCSICNGAQTICRFPSDTPSANCDKYINAPLTSSEIQSLVDKHNELRTNVAEGRETRGNPGPQPAATDMKTLSWDNELATVAQRWADQCAANPHDDCRDIDRFPVGQNVATLWNSEEITEPVVNLINGWYDEVAMFNNQEISRFRFAHETGHYTQLVWANTSLIGCGRVRFWDTGRQMNTLRLICNYGPAGNVIGLPIYNVRTPSFRCSRSIRVKAWFRFCN
ncbi:venom allergen 3-like [Athalia rosae]|uniref:venom allergen 3-like n=1 Tax=Athalia rosae TaxID=37344 RepID=UPI00203412C8|nr:venom allergen 3-like [Athalia rosae]